MTKLSVMNDPKPEPVRAPPPTTPRPYDFRPDLRTERGRTEDRVVKALASVYDPEIPVNVFELGLIYGVDVNDDGHVHVRMTLTAPNCPVAQSMPEEIREKAELAAGMPATVEVVWSPPWHAGMMSEAARLELNL